MTKEDLILNSLQMQNYVINFVLNDMRICWWYVGAKYSFRQSGLRRHQYVSTSSERKVRI